MATVKVTVMATVVRWRGRGHRVKVTEVVVVLEVDVGLMTSAGVGGGWGEGVRSSSVAASQFGQTALLLESGNTGLDVKY